ncbi:MAG: hypothetical protein ACJAW3_000771, partial [Lentimonas sp.]
MKIMNFKQIIRRNYSINILIGLIQAALLVSLQKLQLETKFTVPFIFLIITTNITLLLCLKKNNLSNSILASLVIGVVFFLIASLFFYSLDITSPRQNKYHIFSLFITQIIALYIATPFIQTWINKKKFVFDYKDLFHHSWNNIFIVKIAVILMGISWLLIFLCGGLFTILGIPLLAFFLTPTFSISSTSVLFALGIYIGREKHEIVNSLRSIAIALCNILLPLVLAIDILFMISLLFVG